MSDLKMKRGDSKTVLFQVVRDVFTGDLRTADVYGIPPPGTVPQNLTGFHLWFTAKYHFNDPDPSAVARLDSAALGGVTVLDVALGKAKALVPAQNTVGFPDGPVTLLYDVQTRDGAGVVTTVESGTLLVEPDVTRTTA